MASKSRRSRLATSSKKARQSAHGGVPCAALAHHKMAISRDVRSQVRPSEPTELGARPHGSEDRVCQERPACARRAHPGAHLRRLMIWARRFCTRGVARNHGAPCPPARYRQRRLDRLQALLPRCAASERFAIYSVRYEADDRLITAIGGVLRVVDVNGVELLVVDDWRQRE